jgi:hypothetical protein
MKMEAVRPSETYQSTRRESQKDSNLDKVTFELL